MGDEIYSDELRETFRLGDEIDINSHDVNKFYLVEFKNYLESRNPEIRADWLDYLGLSETKASEIAANCSSNYGSKTELEKLNAYASIAAITEHGEKYRKGVDNIHVKNLGNARDLDDRIRLHVWRHILKNNLFSKTTEEWQVVRNKEIVPKIEQIDLLLSTETVRDDDTSNKANDELPSFHIKKNRAPLDRYLIDPALGLDVNLDHFTLIELWRFDENRNLLIPTDSYGDSGLEKILIKAVRDGELNAIVHKSERPWEKEKGNGTGYIKVDKCDFNDISNTGWLGGSYVRLTIHRDDFKSWLKKTKRQLPDGCLLHLWLEGDGTQSKAVGVDGDDSHDKSELIASRTIPARLLPDANYQFLIYRPFEPVFNPDKPLPTDREPIPSDFVQPEPDEWFLYDSWEIKLACKLITLGYPVCLESALELVKDRPHDYEEKDRFSSIVRVYERALGIAASSVKVGTIKEHDTPANWIAWAKSKGYSVVHLMPGDTQPQAEAVSSNAIASQSPLSGKKFEHQETIEWKAKAREIGQKWMEQQRKEGNDPGVIAIAKYVEGELSNLGITGKRGKFLDFETIKRDALTGITGKPANGKTQ